MFLTPNHRSIVGGRKPFYRDGRGIIPLTKHNPEVYAFKMELPGRAPDATIEHAATVAAGTAVGRFVSIG